MTHKKLILKGLYVEFRNSCYYRHQWLISELQLRKHLIKLMWICLHQLMATD